MDGTDEVSWAEVTVAEGTDGTENLMRSDAWPVGVGLVLCEAEVLGTEVLVSVRTNLEELVFFFLLLQSLDDTDLPELEPWSQYLKNLQPRGYQVGNW